MKTRVAPVLTRAEQKKVREWLRTRDPVGAALDSIERKLKRLERTMRKERELNAWLSARLRRASRGERRGRS